MSLTDLCGKPAKLTTTKARLRAAGAEVLEPSSVWEVLRFRCSTGVGVVYRNRNQKLTANEQAEAAFAILEEGGGSLCAQPIAPKRSESKRRQHQLQTVMNRDGPSCFYCTTPLEIGASVGHSRHPTREHLVPTNQGGPDNVANIFASCAPCNREAGHMSAPEKIAMRDRKRAAMAQWESAA